MAWYYDQILTLLAKIVRSIGLRGSLKCLNSKPVHFIMKIYFAKVKWHDYPGSWIFLACQKLTITFLHIGASILGLWGEHSVYRTKNKAGKLIFYPKWKKYIFLIQTFLLVKWSNLMFSNWFSSKCRIKSKC